ncbi:MAG TPA: putative toxin-antitoxin system toxin component, PIN family [Acetobacteraceae bacterium]|jgi:putative PIN family toxin of toxin-antitoxin system|nr:putative toxin-antitoxin system toxin component, PIN family [Acetobacteraceae bacterium]
MRNDAADRLGRIDAVGAVIKRDGTPLSALRKAVLTDTLALSRPVEDELLEVLSRPRLARFIDPQLREEVIGRLLRDPVRFVPTEQVTDCRDAKDNKYLELAAAARATLIVSSANDHRVLNPWRGVRILRPVEYCAMT